MLRDRFLFLNVGVYDQKAGRKYGGNYTDGQFIATVSLRRKYSDKDNATLLKWAPDFKGGSLNDE